MKFLSKVWNGYEFYKMVTPQAHGTCGKYCAQLKLVDPDSEEARRVV